MCGEIVFEVMSDRLPQKLVWPGYGFHIDVPAGALPPGVTASVAVRAIKRGQFSLSDNRKLISAIYWISCSEVFLKDVAVNIQHCAVITNEEDTTEFKFIIAKCSQDPPYKFVERDGVFNADTQYATVMRKRFSIVGATGPDATKMYYVALKFYKSIPRSVDTNFHLAVLTSIAFKVNKVFADFNYSPCIQNKLALQNYHFIMQYKMQMKDDGWEENRDGQHFIFKDDCITLDIPGDPPVVVNGWQIIPNSTPLEVHYGCTCSNNYFPIMLNSKPLQIDKAAVDRYELDKSEDETSVEVYSPSCTILLQWTGEPGSEVTPLKAYRVKILGTTKPDTSFLIYHNPRLEKKRSSCSARNQTGCNE